MMPIVTLDAASVAFATSSAVTGEPIGRLSVGWYSLTTYGSAIRFLLPVSLTAINSAVLKIFNAENSPGGTFASTLSVRPSSQILPTSALGSEWATFGVDLSINSVETEIDVTTLLQEAFGAEVLDGAVCFLWLDNGSDDGLLQFDGIDPSLEPDIQPPQLILDYATASTPFCAWGITATSSSSSLKLFGAA